jgi:hypothetical protein
MFGHTCTPRSLLFYVILHSNPTISSVSPMDVDPRDLPEPETDSIPDSTLSLLRRLAWLRGLKLPACLPTDYSGDLERKRGSTRLDSSKVTHGRVPRLIRITSWDTIRLPLQRALNALLRDEAGRFPDHLFDHDIPCFRRRAEHEAQCARPSGESGVSHFLKLALFDLLNMLLQHVYSDQTRVWKPIGIGGTGKGDWGLYVNDVLVGVVEIEPHCVSY